MGGISFTPLFWLFGILGAVVGLVGAAVIFELWKLLEAHWR